MRYRCAPDGCHTDPVEGLEGVRCVLHGSGTCAGESPPPAVQRTFDRARGLLDRAAATTSGARAKREVRLAVQGLDEGARAVGRAERRSAVTGDCARALRQLLAEARTRAVRWMREQARGRQRHPPAVR